MTKSNHRRTWWQFSLRTLLGLLMLAASYFAGWVSHREWNKRNVEEAILKATERIGSPTTVETADDAPEMLIVRGRKDDVAEMENALRDIDAAARK